MRRIVLNCIAVLSLVVSAIWFINEPAFEPFLTFLGSLAFLIEFHKDTGEDYLPPNQDKNEDYPDSTVEPVYTNEQKKQTKEQKIAQKLYQYAFAELRANIKRMILISLCSVALTVVIIILNLEDINLFITWAISVALMYFQFTRTIINLDKQVNVSGYYSKIGVPDRKIVKEILLKEKWGGRVRTVYMRSLINLLLMPYLNEFKRFKKRLGLKQ